jgi:hypothetical protein
MAAHISTALNSRLRSLIIPREHGAWGMLLVPLLTAAVVALRSSVDYSAITLFTVAAMSLFWLRTPVESWLGSSPIKVKGEREQALVLRAVAFAGSLAALSVAALLWNGRHRGLLVNAAIGGLAFALQALVKALGRVGRMPAQVIGAIGLTSTAAGAYYVTTGRLDHLAVTLWLANWAFASDQIHFVQLRIHSSRATTFQEKLQQGLPFLVGQIALIAALLTACVFRFLPAAAALAFAPVLLRGMYWFVRGPDPLDVHRLGLAELTQALMFGALLCAGLLV